MATRWSDEQKSAAKQLFGRPLRVALAVWVLERRGEAFFQSEAQAGLQEHGASASGVADELRLFQQFSMLTSFPDGRRLYYVQKDSPYWSAFEAIAGALGIEGPLQRSDST